MSENHLRSAVLLAAGFVIAGISRGENLPEVYALRGVPSQRVTVAPGAYFPRLLLLDDGEMLATFKTGAGHVGKGGKASVSRSKDGGVTWSEPTTGFDLPDADDSMDASTQLKDGTVIYGAVSYSWKGEKYSFEDWRAETYALRSKDRGQTWQPPAKVNIAPYTWAYPFGRIIEMPDGTLLMTLFAGYLPVTLRGSPADDKDDVTRRLRRLADAKPEAQRGDFCLVVRSKDQGQTWGDPSIIARQYNEVCAMRLADGRLMAAIRSSEKGAQLDVTFSSDNGYHWSAPESLTRNQEHPADLLQLRNGDILLSFGERNKPYGVQAMISRDQGRTWDRNNRYILAWDGDHGDLGYPVTVERKDGKLVTIYYIVYGTEGRFQMVGNAPAGAFTKAVIWER
ncbi:MAG: exo-alpha-sialidase [Verrucomicrobia bacterium]|nr:exo-alpha-sialidase [Verrucomicrobiota bacterium]